MRRLVFLRLLGIRPFEGPGDRRVAAARILTIDAFDTLITRSVICPIDVFALCALVLRERSIIAIEPEAWRDLRHQVESRLARALAPDEVRLDEIYEKLVEAGALAACHRLEARDIERAVERAVSRPIAANIAAVNTMNRRRHVVVVISDTYLSPDDLYELLGTAGLQLGRHAIHASSWLRSTKRSGALFSAVLRWMARPARTALHIGDNLSSDVRRARAAGMAVAPFLAGRPNRFERALYERLQTARLLGSIIAGSARATRLGRCFSNAHEQSIWDVSADVTGPLLFSFVAWALSEAMRMDLRTLHFLSRDGEILLRIARELLAGLGAPLECRYLYGSRRSLHLPGVTELGSPERSWILDSATQHSLQDVLGRVDIDVDELLGLLPADSPLRRLDRSARLTPPDAIEIDHCLAIPVVRDLVLAKAAGQRTLCLDYMQNEGLLAGGRIGLVDIGWRGRLQRSLCRAIATVQPDIAARLHGFYFDLKDPPIDAGAMATFSALHPRLSSQVSWAARGPLFEVFCAAHHGPVLRYARDADGNVGPLLASASNPEAIAWGLAVQQEAIVAFAREAMQGLRLAGLDPTRHVAALAPATCDVVRMFTDRPSRTEATAFGSFAHSEDDHHAKFEPIAGPIDFTPHALLKRFGPAHPQRRISFWPEASVVRSLPDWLCGPALAALDAIPGRRR